jgi:proteasome alpha subunit
MRDKADYARKAITRGRSGVVIGYDGGILLISPNPSRALHKFSELYDRIAFAAVGRYNEFERLRQAGVRYADLTGYQYDRQDVTARSLANWYAQLLGTVFTEPGSKPLEVEIVVAEVGTTAPDDQIYRITFDGSVTDEQGYVAMGGESDQVTAVLKERYTDGLTLSAALAVAMEALSRQDNGGRGTAAELEAAILDRTRQHRTFRRLVGPRLEALLAEARPAGAPGGSTATGAGTDATGDAEAGGQGSSETQGDSGGPDGPSAG